MQEKQDEKKMSSLLWGLVKWDTLPKLPIPRRDAGALSASETERGRSTTQRQQHGLRIHLTQGRHTGPAFDRSLPAVYQSVVPVSMAKMIMSRHTFRRPSSRPPPVRNANAPQYSKKAAVHGVTWFPLHGFPHSCPFGFISHVRNVRSSLDTSHSFSPTTILNLAMPY